MTNQIKCPICGNLITRSYDTINGYLCEEHMCCTHCGNGYEFAYGNSIAYMKGKEFYWDYRTPSYDPVFHRVAKAAWQAKHNWRRYRKSYLPKQVDGYTTNQIIFDEEIFDGNLQLRHN